MKHFADGEPIVFYDTLRKSRLLFGTLLTLVLLGLVFALCAAILIPKARLVTGDTGFSTSCRAPVGRLFGGDIPSEPHECVVAETRRIRLGLLGLAVATSAMTVIVVTPSGRLRVRRWLARGWT